MQKFKERREEILGIFSKAKADLEQLNTEIDAQIAQNKEQIASLSAANAEMTALKLDNSNTAKIFAKFFK